MSSEKYMRINNPKMPAELIPRYMKLVEGWTIESFRDKAKDFGRASQDFNDFCYAMEALPGFSPSDELIDTVLQSIKCTAPFVDATPYEHRIMVATETMNGNLVDLYLDLRWKLRCLDRINHKYNTKQDAVLYSDGKRYHLFDAKYWKITNMNFHDWSQIVKAIEHMHNALTNNFTPFVVAAPGTKFENSTERFLSDHWNGFDVLKIMLTNDQEFNFMMAALLDRDFYNAIVIKSYGGKEVTVIPADHHISYSSGGEYLLIVKKKEVAQAA